MIIGNSEFEEPWPCTGKNRILIQLRLYHPSIHMQFQYSTYIYIITSPPASCPRDCCDFNGSPTKLPVCCWKICCPCRKACSMASDPRTPAARHWWSQWAPIVASQSLGGARKIEEMRRRCDPNSVGYKNYSQAWGIFSQNGLSYKMPIHFQQPWKTDELEYCHSLSLRNARLFVKKKTVEAHTFLTKCLCCLDHVLLLQNAKNPYEAHHVFLQNAIAIFTMG